MATWLVNQTKGSARKGQRYQIVQQGGRRLHVYQNGARVDVGRAVAPAATYGYMTPLSDRQLSQQASQQVHAQYDPLIQQQKDQYAISTAQQRNIRDWWSQYQQQVQQAEQRVAGYYQQAAAATDANSKAQQSSDQAAAAGNQAAANQDAALRGATAANTGQVENSAANVRAMLANSFGGLNRQLGANQGAYLAKIGLAGILQGGREGTAERNYQNQVGEKIGQLRSQRGQAWGAQLAQRIANERQYALNRATLEAQIGKAAATNATNQARNTSAAADRARTAAIRRSEFIARYGHTPEFVARYPRTAAADLAKRNAARARQRTSSSGGGGGRRGGSRTTGGGGGGRGGGGNLTRTQRNQVNMAASRWIPAMVRGHNAAPNDILFNLEKNYRLSPFLAQVALDHWRGAGRPGAQPVRLPF